MGSLKTAAARIRRAVGRRRAKAVHGPDTGLLTVVLLSADEEGQEAAARAGQTLAAVLAQRRVRLQVILPAPLADGCSDPRLHPVPDGPDFWPAARRLVRGSWVAVLRPGSVPTPDTYARLVDALRESGGAIATAAAPGNLAQARLCGAGQALTPARYLEEGRDLTLWTKVLDAGLWQQTAAMSGQAPDQAPTTGEICDALLLAAYRGTGSILPVDVPAGEDRLPPPAPVTTPEGMHRFRIRARNAVTGQAEARSPQPGPTDAALPPAADALTAAWLRGLLDADWVRICAQLRRHDERYSEQVFAAARELLQACSGFLEARFGLHDRVLLHLCATDSRSDIDVVLAELQDHGPGVRLRLDSPGPDAPGAHAPGAPSPGAPSSEVHGQPGPSAPEQPALQGVPTYLPLLGAVPPAQLLQIGPADVHLRTRLSGYEWEETTLNITGQAWLAGLGDECGPVEVAAILREERTGHAVPVQVRSRPDAQASEVAGDAWNRHRLAGFLMQVPAETLLKGGHGTAPQWAVELTLRQGGFSRTGRLLERDADLLGPRLDVGPLTGDERLVGLFDRTRGLRLASVRYRVVAAETAVDGRKVRIRVAAGAEPGGGIRELRVGGTDCPVVLQRVADPGLPGLPDLPEPPEPGTWFAGLLPPEFPAPAAPGSSDTPVTAVDGQGHDHPVGWGPGTRALEAAAGLRLQPTVNGFGFLHLAAAAERIAVTGFTSSSQGTDLTLHGLATVDPTRNGFGLRLAGGPACFEPVAADAVPEPEGGGWRFAARFDLRVAAWDRGTVPARPGRYRLEFYGPRLPPRPVPAVLDLRAGAPEASGHLLRVLVRAAEPGVVVDLLAPYRGGERGPWSRRRLIEAYQRSDRPLEDAAFFESYAGKDAGDSLDPLHRLLGREEPGWRRYWSVADFSVPVPEGAWPLLRFSEEWFRILATARLIVSNDTLPPFFRKRPGQFYLQTWHGTPLKRIGLDTPPAGLTPSYRRILQREPASWDLLLAQGPVAAETLRSAFRYAGPVLARGYPRNDVLASAQAPQIRDRTRTLLGVEPGQTAVLYLPTWRDDTQDGRGRARPVRHLDTGALRAALGPGYVCLVRGHHRTTGAGPITEGTVDVTGFPDIGALYLAADALITDYSSAMFDFCLTGKPIYLLAPDERRYSRRTRGFYPAFTEPAAGPRVADTAALCTALAATAGGHPPAGSVEFRKRFGAAESGKSAELALERWKLLRTPAGSVRKNAGPGRGGDPAGMGLAW